MLYFKKYHTYLIPRGGGSVTPPPPQNGPNGSPILWASKPPKRPAISGSPKPQGLAPALPRDPTERPSRDTSAGGRREQDEFERRKKDAEKKGELLEEPVKAAEEEVVGRAEPPGEAVWPRPGMNETPGNPVGGWEGDPHLAGGSKYPPPPCWAVSYSSGQRGRLPPPNVHRGWKLLRDRDCKKRAHFKRRPRKEASRRPTGVVCHRCCNAPSPAVFNEAPCLDHHLPPSVFIRHGGGCGLGEGGWARHPSSSACIFFAEPCWRGSLE